uniref:Uncharacterized protein n=1 Tax=Cacopsylla melanoneura TaxID=428564 RepID=A0A8D8Y8N5_9HEMI
MEVQWVIMTLWVIIIMWKTRFAHPEVRGAERRRPRFTTKPPRPPPLRHIPITRHRAPSLTTTIMMIRRPHISVKRRRSPITTIIKRPNPSITVLMIALKLPTRMLMSTGPRIPTIPRTRALKILTIAPAAKALGFPITILTKTARLPITNLTKTPKIPITTRTKDRQIPITIVPIVLPDTI